MIAFNLACIPIEFMYSVVIPGTFMSIAGFATSQILRAILMSLAGVYSFSGLSKLIALSCSTMEEAIRIAPVILIILTIYSGFLIREYDMPTWLSWLVLLSPYRWFMFGLSLAVFPSEGFLFNVPNEVVLGINGTSSRTIWECAVYLILIGLISRITGALIYCMWSSKNTTKF